MTVRKKTDESQIAKGRKEQVLAATVECVRREGFHGASMSHISAASGMSSGHIYHYFGSKQGIIEGIVEREHSELRQFVDDVKTASQEVDVVSAIVSQTPRSVDHFIDHNQASLTMEILAESARNPEVARLIQQNDEEVFQEFYNLLGGDPAEVRARCELLAALIGGLSIRTLRNPKLDTALDKSMLQNVVKYILEG